MLYYYSIIWYPQVYCHTITVPFGTLKCSVVLLQYHLVPSGLLPYYYSTLWYPEVFCRIITVPSGTLKFTVVLLQYPLAP
jgi:hypothetical protein